MKIATITETKNRLSALLDRVWHGETILIMDRSRPVARIEPVVAPDATDAEGRLARLERAGLVRRGRGARIKEIADNPPPRPIGGADILKVLLAERAIGR